MIITWRLEIPNQEVRTIYVGLVHTWFAEKVESERLRRLIIALENGEVEIFEDLLADMVVKVLSWHDTRAPDAEQFYHAFVLGVFVWMSGKYEIKSNREAGLGRYDVMLMPKDRNRRGIILEFKKVNTRRKETPEQALAKAIAQIETKRYTAELEDAGVTEILKLAIAFQGKELWVKQV